MRSTSTYNNPKPCDYNCETRIYWNNQENEYFEALSGNRHQCTNRKQQQQQSNYNNKKATYSSSQQTTSIVNKPSYYSTNNKPYYSNYKPKPKMSNSLELLQGSIIDI